MDDLVTERNRERLERETWTKAGPIITRMPDEEVLALEERAMATVGDPSALGLWGFATGTWILGTIIGGAIHIAPAEVAAAKAAKPYLARSSRQPRSTARFWQSYRCC